MNIKQEVRLNRLYAQRELLLDFIDELEERLDHIEAVIRINGGEVPPEIIEE